MTKLRRPLCRKLLVQLALATVKLTISFVGDFSNHAKMVCKNDRHFHFNDGVAGSYNGAR